jgi:hypothetical protein
MKKISPIILLLCFGLVVGCQSDTATSTTSSDKIRQLRPGMSAAQVQAVLGPCSFSSVNFGQGNSSKTCFYRAGSDEWLIMISDKDRLERACKRDESECIVDLEDLPENQ